jgi:hypothetical protein
MLMQAHVEGGKQMSGGSGNVEGKDVAANLMPAFDAAAADALERQCFRMGVPGAHGDVRYVRLWDAQFRLVGSQKMKKRSMPLAAANGGRMMLLASDVEPYPIALYSVLGYKRKRAGRRLDGGESMREKADGDDGSALGDCGAALPLMAGDGDDAAAASPAGDADDDAAQLPGTLDSMPSSASSASAAEAASSGAAATSSSSSSASAAAAAAAAASSAAVAAASLDDGGMTFVGADGHLDVLSADGSEVSWATCLKSEWVEPSPSLADVVAYDPLLLDDPTLTAGKHRTVYSAMSIRVSLLPYVTKKELKEEINEQFCERHPLVASRQQLRLTTIRSLKKRMLHAVEDSASPTLGLAPVALAYVLVEKLIWRGAIVTRDTRYLYAAVCVYLAVKFMHDSALSKTYLRRLLQSIERHLHASPDKVLATELPVFVALNFSLYVPPRQIIPHFERLKTHDLNHNK